MARAFSPEMKDVAVDWETIDAMIQEGDQGKLVEVEDEAHAEPLVARNAISPR